MTINDLKQLLETPGRKSKEQAIEYLDSLKGSIELDKFLKTTWELLEDFIKQSRGITEIVRERSTVADEHKAVFFEYIKSVEQSLDGFEKAIMQEKSSDSDNELLKDLKSTEDLTEEIKAVGLFEELRANKWNHRAYLLEPHRIITIEPSDGKIFTLEELNDFVGGYIELAESPNKEYHAIVNEEGLLLNLPLNQMYLSLFGHELVGNVVVMQKHLIV